MQRAFDLIKQRLEEERHPEICGGWENLRIDRAINIVNQVASEYGGGWIPCSERLPEEAYGCLVTVMDCNPVTGQEFENILPYFVGYDSHTWNNADGEEIPFDVIAWQPLPEPYKAESEE